MEFEALDMFKKSALYIHANNSIWSMQGGILPLRYKFKINILISLKSILAMIPIL